MDVTVGLRARLRPRPVLGRSWILSSVLVALVLTAWAAVWAWSFSPAARYLDHRELGGAGLNGTVLALFCVGWLLMTTAMMLPTTLPFVATFRALVDRRPHPDRLAALVVVAYLGVWTLAGLGTYLLDAAVHLLVAAIPWLTDRPEIIVGMTLLVAGVYQFSPLKYHCLDACRAPLGFILGRWHGHRPAREAFMIGARHAAFCLGCCWSLMLVLFALGMGNLVWMVGAGIVVTVEKNVPGGRRLGRPLGVVLLLAGGIVLAS